MYVKLINVYTSDSLNLFLDDALMLVNNTSSSVNANLMFNFICSNVDDGMYIIGISRANRIESIIAQFGQSNIEVIGMTSGTVKIYGLSIEVD